MASYRSFNESGDLQIEVDGPAAGSSPSGGYFPALLGALQTIASGLSSQIAAWPKEQQPTELEIRFDVAALDGEGVAFSRGSDVANFHISMRWSNESGGIDSVLPMIGESGP
jgi:hypothetical protein